MPVSVSPLVSHDPIKNINHVILKTVPSLKYKFSIISINTLEESLVNIVLTNGQWYVSNTLKLNQNTGLLLTKTLQ